MTTILHTDLDVFPLCFGGNVFGWTADRETSFDILDLYAAAGGNFIDTADAYPRWAPGHSGGESELIIGEWMAARANCDQLVVTTKIGGLHGGHDGGLTAQHVQQATEASLRRLGVETIDLLYAHLDDLTTPLAETLEAFDTLVRSGKVRYIAASQYSADRLVEGLAISDREGFARWVALQPLYNLVERGYEEEIGPLAAREGLAVVPFFGLASGFLTGKYRPGVKVESARSVLSGPGNALTYTNPRGFRVLAALDDVAEAHGVQPSAVAIAWLLAQPTVTAPIASARTKEQLEGILPALGLDLSIDEIDRLSSSGDEDFSDIN